MSTPPELAFGSVRLQSGRDDIERLVEVHDVGHRPHSIAQQLHNREATLEQRNQSIGVDLEAPVGGERGWYRSP
jgi:hypothetical protein